MEIITETLGKVSTKTVSFEVTCITRHRLLALASYTSAEHLHRWNIDVVVVVMVILEMMAVVGGGRAYWR